MKTRLANLIVVICSIACGIITPSCTGLALDDSPFFSQTHHRTNDYVSGSATNDDFYWAESDGVRNVLRRASQLANIAWRPLFDVPANVGVYSACVDVVGIPYSSVKQLNKYVGQDVSLHTFMTAVHNPRSVLYTENLKNAPYFGSNCAAYYGTVCSSAVAYALNLKAPYPSSFFPALPEFDVVPIINLASLKPGDVLWHSGHVFMIFNIHMDNDESVTAVSYFEAASRYARIETLSAEDFEQKLINEDYRAFRYREIDYVADYAASPYVSVGNERAQTIKYNESLCPNRGDASVYRVDEPVIINIFDTSFDTLVLEHTNGIAYYPSEKDVRLENLLEGEYVAYLMAGFRKSDSVRFIVANPRVTVQTLEKLHVSFSCEQGTPSYCVLCDEVGGYKSIYVLSEEDINKGCAYIDPLNAGPYYCKVIFNTSYGTVINNPVFIP